MIDYTIEFLARAGVQQVFVFCLSHAEQVVEYIEGSARMNTPGLSVFAT